MKESEHNIKSTKDFIRQIKKEPVPARYKMVSFHVKSLFANVPSDRKIVIILKRIYDHKELETPIIRCEMKETLRKKCMYSELFWSAFSRIIIAGVSLNIQSKCGTMWTRITPNTNIFMQWNAHFMYQ